MHHEKIYKRKDGSQVKISVWLYVQENKSYWGYLIFLREAGSDRWLDPFSDRDYLDRIVKRNLDRPKMGTFDTYVSAEEILAAKFELWQKIKPS
jgi:hypothetical protein